MLVGVLAGFTIGGCLGMPNNVRPVSDFELNRYLGRWYKIARLDHFFEQSLENVTAEYSIRKDGGVNVVNRGFSTENGQPEAGILSGGNFATDITPLIVIVQYSTI
jgi:apolipoprotein D and lipocalin family protein